MEDLTLCEQTKLMNGSDMQKKRYGRYGLNQDLISMVIGDSLINENIQYQNDYLHQSLTTQEVEQNSKSIETLKINGTSFQPSGHFLKEEKRADDKALGFSIKMCGGIGSNDVHQKLG